MRSCREIAIALASEQNLSFLGRMELRFHHLLCKPCEFYTKHLKIMSDGFKKLFSKITHVNSRELVELEQKVMDRILGNKKS